MSKPTQCQAQITLKAARVNIGMTLKQAAEKFHIHHETLSNYEADSSNVPLSFFSKIKQVYGVPTENIFFGKRIEYVRALRKIVKEEYQTEGVNRK